MRLAPIDVPQKIASSQADRACQAEDIRLAGVGRRRIAPGRCQMLHEFDFARAPLKCISYCKLVIDPASLYESNWYPVEHHPEPDLCAQTSRNATRSCPENSVFRQSAAADRPHCSLATSAVKSRISPARSGKPASTAGSAGGLAEASDLAAAAEGLISAFAPGSAADDFRWSRLRRGNRHDGGLRRSHALRLRSPLVKPVVPAGSHQPDNDNSDTRFRQRHNFMRLVSELLGCPASFHRTIRFRARWSRPNGACRASESERSKRSPEASVPESVGVSRDTVPPQFIR